MKRGILHEPSGITPVPPPTRRELLVIKARQPKLGTLNLKNVLICKRLQIYDEFLRGENNLAIYQQQPK